MRKLLVQHRSKLRGARRTSSGGECIKFYPPFAGIFPGASYINVICHFAFDKKMGGTAVIKV